MFSSGDMGAHAVGTNILALLAQIRRSQIQVSILSTGKEEGHADDNSHFGFLDKNERMEDASSFFAAMQPNEDTHSSADRMKALDQCKSILAKQSRTKSAKLELLHKWRAVTGSEA